MLTASTVVEIVEIKSEIGGKVPIEEIESLHLGVISGGQTGADIAGTLAGIACGLYVGGCAPKGYWTANGFDLRLKAWGFSQTKSGGAQGYAERDQANVRLADAVIAFKVDLPLTGRGTTKTFNYALTNKYVDTALYPYNSANPVVDLTVPAVNASAANNSFSPIIAKAKAKVRKYDDSTIASSASASASVSSSSFFGSLISKPVLLVWNPLTHQKRAEFPQLIASFLRKYAAINNNNNNNNAGGTKRFNVMVSGPLEKTMPGIQAVIQEMLTASFKLVNAK